MSVRRRREPQWSAVTRGHDAPPEELYGSVLRAARELLAVRSPLDAELIVSDMLGAWWGSRLRGRDVETELGEGLVGYAATAGTPAALALLVGVAYLGTSRQAAKAEGAALAMMEAGVARPRWAERVGAVKPGACYVSRDACGDQDTVICTFEYKDDPSQREPHALVVLVDYNMRGMARDAWISSRVEKLIDSVRTEADADPLQRFEPIEPQQARALLESAMKVTDETPGPPTLKSFASFRAFARSRIRALPPGRKRPSPLHREGPYSRERRAMLAAEFLASAEAGQLSDLSAASRCADHVINYGCDEDFGRPLRVSPLKCETLLLDWLPRRILLSPDEQEAMPHVLAAWVRWAGNRLDLPREAVRRTLDAMWEATGRFPIAYRDPVTFGLDRELVNRLLPDLDLSALDRRAFAFPMLQGRAPMPQGSVRGADGEDVDLDALDPADEADRRILLELDHADADLGHTEDDGEGLDEHLAWHLELAARLWDGDPPQLWEAAKRLLDQGMDRHDILHVLMETFERIGDDPEELAAALDELG